MAVNIVSTIKTYISHMLDIKNNKANKAPLKAFYETQKSLSIVGNSRNADVYSAVNDVQAVLCGNMLRIYFTAERKSNTGAGNINNEIIVTVGIDTQGLFTSYINVGGNTGKSGDLGVFFVNVEGISGNTMELTIRLAATHAAMKSFGGHILMPVKLNISST